MFEALTCLALDHDWRLVTIAGVVCFLASAVAISMFHRALATAGTKRFIWLALDATAAGCGIWATHFIAMLAYSPSTGIGYDLGLTVVSLLVAALITGLGLSIALHARVRRSAMIGGAVLGLGVAAMHFIGMQALEVPGRFAWLPAPLIAAIILGTVFGCLALVAASRGDDWINSTVATTLLTLAIVSMHFTAMGAVVIHPDPTLGANPLSLSPESLSAVIAGAMAIILGMCLVAALSDQWAESKLSRQKVLLDTALSNMSQGLCMFDAEGCATLLNDRYAKMMNMPMASLLGQPLLKLLQHRKASGQLAGSPDELFAQMLSDARKGKSNNRVIETAAGHALRVVEQPMDGGGWVSTVEDITESLQAQAQIAHMAHHDSLTGLPNRTLFHEQLANALRRTTRREQIAVLYLDLDHFKDVNDTLGHPIGDGLLKEVAARLLECVREGDTVARLGGDEFAIVQADSELQLSGVTALAGRLIEVIGAPYLIEGHQVVVGTSIGISLAPDDGKDPHALLKNADLALYRAKADGRGAFRFFEVGMDARAHERRLMELDLRSALARNEFDLYYQPIQDIKADRIICFEALIRWNHPLRGTLSPLSFIPLAEETGLIIPIGEWVLRHACAAAASWSQDVRIAVNLSPAQFKNRNLVGSVIDALANSGLAANRLELEITEAVLLQDSEATLATLHKLRDLGVRISMDDFGTGYSSLSYLRSFPFDKIKIDESFIRDLATRPDSMAIVRAVAGLGRSLGIATTAEGVETSEQLALLRSEGCDEVQGYLFSAPQPAENVEKMLSKGRLRVVA